MGVRSLYTTVDCRRFSAVPLLVGLGTSSKLDCVCLFRCPMPGTGGAASRIDIAGAWSSECEFASRWSSASNEFQLQGRPANYRISERSWVRRSGNPTARDEGRRRAEKVAPPCGVLGFTCQPARPSLRQGNLVTTGVWRQSICGHRRRPVPREGLPIASIGAYGIQCDQAGDRTSNPPTCDLREAGTPR